MQDGHQDLLSTFVEYIKVGFNTVSVNSFENCVLYLWLAHDIYWVHMKTRDEN